MTSKIHHQSFSDFLRDIERSRSKEKAPQAFTRIPPNPEGEMPEFLVEANWKPSEALLTTLKKQGYTALSLDHLIRRFKASTDFTNIPSFKRNSAFLMFAKQSSQVDPSRRLLQHVVNTKDLAQTWAPTDNIFEYLLEMDIPRHFVDQCLTVFRQELTSGKFASMAISRLDHAFLHFVRNQFELKAKNAGLFAKLTSIGRDWRPDASVYEMATLAGIPDAFVQESLSIFIDEMMAAREGSKKWSLKFYRFLESRWSRHPKC